MAWTSPLAGHILVQPLLFLSCICVIFVYYGIYSHNLGTCVFTHLPWKQKMKDFSFSYAFCMHVLTVSLLKRSTEKKIVRRHKQSDKKQWPEACEATYAKGRGIDAEALTRGIAPKRKGVPSNSACIPVRGEEESCISFWGIWHLIYQSYLLPLFLGFLFHFKRRSREYALLYLCCHRYFLQCTALVSAHFSLLFCSHHCCLLLSWTKGKMQGCDMFAKRRD